MEDVRFYDWEFRLLHIESKFVSLNWDIYYNAVGAFEGHFPLKDELLNAVMGNDYIVIVQGRKQAIVTGIQLTDSGLVVYGKTCDWILTRRAVQKFNTNEWTECKNIGDIARYILREGFGDVIETGDIELDDKTEVPTKDGYYFWRNSINTCSDALIDVLDDGGAGHEVVYDTQKRVWRFCIILGRKIDLIVSQSERNAYDVNYSRDLQNYYTDGVYEFTPEPVTDEDGNTADTETEIRTIDGGTGKTGLYKWVAPLTGGNDSEARSDLKSKKIEEIASAKMYGLKWGEDYELGDVVRLQLEFGGWRKTKAKRIDGVHIWYENNNTGEEPVFREENNA